jgi:hypothetical protein
VLRHGLKRIGGVLRSLLYISSLFFINGYFRCSTPHLKSTWPLVARNALPLYWRTPKASETPTTVYFGPLARLWDVLERFSNHIAQLRDLGSNIHHTSALPHWRSFPSLGSFGAFCRHLGTRTARSAQNAKADITCYRYRISTSNRSISSLRVPPPCKIIVLLPCGQWRAGGDGEAFEDLRRVVPLLEWSGWDALITRISTTFTTKPLLSFALLSAVTPWSAHWEFHLHLHD